ncbi:MAG: carboxymuconolactone decarboxylase family protein [Cyanobacteria bacterium]|nr:carboxymuconolactone decarboxylase family protein [Cyanobacteriota bacterium]
MPRIQPNLHPDSKTQEQLNGVKKMMGSLPNLFTTMAHSPAGLSYYLGAMQAMEHTTLTPALREQLAVAVAGTNHCDYCASAHTALGKLKNISGEELTCNLHAESHDPKVQAALVFAKAIVAERGMVSDTELKAVRSAGYSDCEVIEILMVTSVNIFTNYFNHLAQTEVDFPAVKTGKIAHV